MITRRADAEAQFARMRETAYRGAPLDADEQAEYDSLRAREMARAEARRNPQPQLDLPEGM